MPNTFTCVFEILVSKCKIICRFKISAFAGMTRCLINYGLLSNSLQRINILIMN